MFGMLGKMRIVVLKHLHGSLLWSLRFGMLFVVFWFMQRRLSRFLHIGMHTRMLDWLYQLFGIITYGRYKERSPHLE